jgi:hypothetical protein
MAQTPPPHNPNAPIPLGGPASAHEPRLSNSTCITPPPQSVQAERGAERHGRCRRLPERREEQFDQHPQTRQGPSSRFVWAEGNCNAYSMAHLRRCVPLPRCRVTQRNYSPFNSSAACVSSIRQVLSLMTMITYKARTSHLCSCATLSNQKTSMIRSPLVGVLLCLLLSVILIKACR